MWMTKASANPEVVFSRVRGVMMQERGWDVNAAQISFSLQSQNRPAGSDLISANLSLP